MAVRSSFTITDKSKTEIVVCIADNDGEPVIEITQGSDDIIWIGLDAVADLKQTLEKLVEEVARG